jgi:hypothetical protein
MVYCERTHKGSALIIADSSKHHERARVFSRSGIVRLQHQQIAQLGDPEEPKQLKTKTNKYLLTSTPDIPTPTCAA